jgi:glyoxylase-like metal-dependent hydrolase (beta-lactamase superfamily II)
MWPGVGSILLLGFVLEHRAFQVPAPRVDAETIAPGVSYLRGGSHHSVAIEMRDHVVLVEAPLGEARSVALLAKLTELAPQKPLRYVVNTHHHFDHSGGLRTMVNQGATVVTQELNRPFYETAWAAPRTLGPDALSKSGKGAGLPWCTCQRRRS